MEDNSCSVPLLAFSLPFLVGFWRLEMLLPSRVVTEGFVEEESPA